MYDFDREIDRRGTWSVQWDGIADRFGVPDLLPFTISDMDFASPPEVLAALRERVGHGVFGYTDWRLGDFREAIRHWYATRYDTAIDPDSLVYAPPCSTSFRSSCGCGPRPATAWSSTPPRTTASARP